MFTFGAGLRVPHFEAPALLPSLSVFFFFFTPLP